MKAITNAIDGDGDVTMTGMIVVTVVVTNVVATAAKIVHMYDLLIPSPERFIFSRCYAVVK